MPARQQTLRNTIEWSYDLLTEAEKQLFCRMAVFQGGRTFEGLERVCNYDGQLQIDVLEGVGSLVSKSLLQQREGRDGEPRFWMLETIHEYAREKLQESGKGAALQREHARYFMELAEEAEPQLTGAEQVEWLAWLENEYDNIRAALGWARAANDGGYAGDEEVGETADAGEVGLRLAGALWRFWYARGYFSEGREQLAGVLGLVSVRQQSGPSKVAREARGAKAKALYGMGVMAERQGDYALEHTLHKESLAIRRELGDKVGIAQSLNGLGNVALYQGDYASARTLHEESLAIRRELGDKWGIALSLSNLAVVASKQGDYASAGTLLEEGLAIRSELGDKYSIAQSLGNLGIVAHNQGNYTSARSLVEESLAIQRELGDKGGIAFSLGYLGNVTGKQGDHASARTLHEESLAIRSELGDKAGIASSLNYLGHLAHRQGDAIRAGRLYSEGLNVSREIGAKEEIAISLTGLAAVACTAKQSEKGATLLGAVEALLEATAVVLDPVDRAEYERGVAAARAQLDAEAFAKTWAEGRAMSMEQAIEYALEGV